MAGLAMAAYAVGRWIAVAATPARLTELEGRLARLEKGRGDHEPESTKAPAQGPLTDKELTAFHYETLASQAVQERRMDELDARLLGVERREHQNRARRCADRQHATTGESRHG
jgi:hypothetical protein